MRALGYFTFMDLTYDRWRSLLTILSLAVVVTGYLLLASMSQAFLVVGRQSTLTDNLVIITTDAVDPMESSLDGSVLQTALEIAQDRILRAFPTLFRHMNINGQIMQVRAVPLDEMSAALNLTLLQGNWPAGTRQIVVGEDLARLASWSVGSTVNIYGTDFQVAGLVRASGNNLAAIWMTNEEGLRLFGDSHGFQVAYLPLAPNADPESVRSLLQSDPRISGHYTVYLENAVSNGYSQLNHNLVTLSSIMAIVSLLAITFGVYNSTSLSLTERGREIGLLRVLGFTQGKLRSVLLARATVLTLAAYAIGWGILSSYYEYRSLHSPLSFTEAPLNLHLSVSTSLTGLLLSLLFAFLGVWLTSRRLAGLNPQNEND